MLAGRKSHDEFLDEGGDVFVGDDLAFPFFDVEHRGRYANLHVVLYLYLAAEAPVVFHLFASEVHGLGGKYVASAFEYLYLTLSAAALSAACRREKYILVGKGRQKGLA